MHPDLLPHLRCPVCGQPMHQADAAPPRALRCPAGHSFDIARQGYVNLLTGRAPHVGDTAEMIAAREEFLAAGHYDPFSAALATAAARAVPRPVRSGDGAGEPVAYPDLVVDAGAGTGRYLAAVLDAVPTAVGLALDVSKPALRRAARAHPRAGAAVCDTWGRLPLADATVAVLVNVFAPRNGPEFCRVLRPDGALLVVTPTAEHLVELVDRLGLLRVDPTKGARVAGSLAGHFELIGQSTHRHRLQLTREEVRTLVGMGPSAWHSDPTRLTARIAALPEPVTVTAAVRLTRYRPT
ncbi:putative RNA methyltransferase [Micromonospora echinospora]